MARRTTRRRRGGMSPQLQAQLAKQEEAGKKLKLDMMLDKMKKSGEELKKTIKNPVSKAGRRKGSKTRRRHRR